MVMKCDSLAAISWVKPGFVIVKQNTKEHNPAQIVRSSFIKYPISINKSYYYSIKLRGKNNGNVEYLLAGIWIVGAVRERP